MTLKEWFDINGEIVDAVRIGIRVRKKRNGASNTIIESSSILKEDAIELFGYTHLTSVSPEACGENAHLYFVVYLPENVGEKKDG